jgi:hypothetical protein
MGPSYRWCSRCALRALFAIAERQREENVCDVCAGSGTPASGGECICGGTGMASRAVPYLRNQLFALRAQLDEALEWKRAVEDAAVTDWTYNASHTPREAVAALLAWQCKLALDPRVSEEAARLHAQLDAARKVVESARLEAACTGVPHLVRALTAYDAATLQQETNSDGK